jgi:hypothetical protein
MKALAIVLIVAGVLLMIFTGINLVTEEKVVDFGAVEITKQENNPISWSPIVGGILLLTGVIMLLTGNRKTA